MSKRVALITGGASGIGRALGERLAERGVTVVLADRQLELAEEVAAGIGARGGAAWAASLDVRDASSFRELAAEVARREGSIDYFFNNAGIAVAGEMVDYDDRAWDDVLDVNLRGVGYGINAVYPIMVAQRSGHIINTASMAGWLPMPRGASYAASKHAVVGITKSLRIEGAAHGVRASVLCPGAIQTPILLGGTFGGHVGRRVPDSVMKKFWKRARPMDVNAFAVEVLKDVDANEPYIIVPRWWKAIWLFERFAPRMSLRLWSRVYARQRAELEASAADPHPAHTTDAPVHAE